MTDSHEKNQKLRVGLVSLGCAKNLVDAELMLGALMKSGIEITNDADTADALIINTCSFIDSAQEESVDTILEYAANRDKKCPSQSLIVSGCLPQRYRTQLPKLMPEIDLFMGVDQVPEVGKMISQAIHHRAEKLLQQPENKSRKSDKTARKQMLDNLAELAKIYPDEEGAASDSVRGISQPGATRIVLGAKPKSDAPPVVNVQIRPRYVQDFTTPRFRLTPRHFAYLKIAEGCNHPCSFCIIPQMRGSYRSRAQADIVKEARQLLKEGVKEINLISQDSTYYGMDLRTNRTGAISSPGKFADAARTLAPDAATLSSLLRELNELPGKFWIRLLYTHPAHWTDELIQTIAECRKVARYVDIPLQHIHDNMLERMRRETSKQFIEDLIAKIRRGIPGIALRTTFIVGFPGETETYFETLLEFIRSIRFERLGVFTFSQEEGTRAGKMSGQIPTKVKQKRREQAMAEQHKVARDISEAFVGKSISVLVEGSASARQIQQANINTWEHGASRETDSRAGSLKGNYLIARGEADAPDIDGRVFVRGNLPIGQFAKVRIVGHTDYDLIAEPTVSKTK